VRIKIELREQRLRLLAMRKLSPLNWLRGFTTTRQVGVGSNMRPTSLTPMVIDCRPMHIVSADTPQPTIDSPACTPR
jgi:hypothetical protein